MAGNPDSLGWPPSILNAIGQLANLYENAANAWLFYQ